MSSPLRIGIIGMGGFAGAHHNAVAKLEERGACRLTCTCDPQMAAFSERQQELRFAERDVRLYTDYLEMLDACRDELDVVTIPTPIPLHASMHRACVERGLPVYLEKPPTLNWAELDEMLAVEEKAIKLANVGFNFIIDPQRRALKRRVVEGEFGAVKRVTVFGLWPRDDRYYARAAWAGRLLMNGQLVLDSPMGNALAHRVHNALFWAGTRDCWSWGSIDSVTAELYRAHKIEGTDTVFVKAALDGGIDLSIAMTHACDNPHRHNETVECELATITYVADMASPEGACQGYTITWHDGREESGRVRPPEMVGENIRHYLRYVQGLEERPMTRLIDSRPFVQVNDLAYIATGQITQMPEEMINHTPTHDGKGVYSVIHDIEPIVQCFLATGDFPSTQGALTPVVPGTRATVDDLPRLLPTVEAMR